MGDTGRAEQACTSVTFARSRAEFEAHGTIELVAKISYVVIALKSSKKYKNLFIYPYSNL